MLQSSGLPRSMCSPSLGFALHYLDQLLTQSGIPHLGPESNACRGMLREGSLRMTPRRYGS